MTTLTTPLPDPPSRSTQSQQEFSEATDNWLSAQQVFGAELNTVAIEVNAFASSAAASAASASADADRAEGAAAFRVSIAVREWADLAAVTGTSANQSAGVFGPDAGTHTDPVVGGTVDNIGVYSWSVSPAGWQRLNDFSGGAVAWGDITDKPSVFAPDTHTHAISDVTDLQTTLDAKALAGAIGSSGLTMATARLLGRTTSSTGAVEEIAIGDGLTLSGGELSYSGTSSMVYPGAGIAVSTGSAWTTSLSAPSGALVGTTASQTLTNKTLTSPTINGATLATSTYSSGTITAGPSVSDTGTIAVDSCGFRGTPRVTGTTRTLQLSDAGKLMHLSGNITIPANSSVAFPIGTAIELSNSSGSTITVAITTDTLRWAGTTSTGTRTIAVYGLAYLKKVNTTEWKITGTLT